MFVVRRVNVLHAPRELILRLDLRRAPAFILGRRHEPLHLARGKAFLVHVERLQQSLDERELVLGVEDLKRLWQSGFPVVRAQQAVAQAVEGTDPHAAGVDRQHCRDAGEHLLCRLIGERDRNEPVRARLPGLDQPGHPRREYARLAAAGTGEDQRRLVRTCDRFELAFV